MTRSIVVFALGGAVGYVLGARAGRERYDQLVEAGRFAQSTGRVTANVASASAKAAAGAVTLGRKAVAKARGDRQIQLPDAPVYGGVTPPATF
jgi:hypothetical protein